MSGPGAARTARGLANTYAGAIIRGESVPEIARGMNMSPSQLRNLVGRARSKGLLSHPPDGRAGGTLTPAGRRVILDSFDQEDGHDGAR